MLLPPEIWLEIFEWATYNSILQILDGYTPFQPLPNGSIRDPNLQTRVTLSRVCRQWRTWALHSLYQDIKIKIGMHALQQALSGHEQPVKRFYGEMVRRVVLPYQSTVGGPSGPLKSIEILKLCPYIHTLYRPQHLLLESLHFEYETDDIPLPSLQRLEWWHHSEAERCGGINSLGSVLRSAPNLRYLFIGGVFGLTRICMGPEQIHLHALETLRLHVISGLLLRQIVVHWALPSLTRIVIDSPLLEQGMHSVWEAFGNQLEVVEFGKHVRFLMNDNLSPCLDACPRLKELNFHIFFTVPAETNLEHTSLNTVGLHAQVNSLLADGGTVWALIEQHFEVLANPRLSSLQQIVLYGDWRPVLCHHKFSLIKNKMRDSGRILQLADRTGTHMTILR
ncbi:hypothetical protein B0H34DRAFT_779213 [Crassisporium funariophilum]|nr:hypothetical protein B0H34DRAFT_779213 [Crassisporium funariophilum]